MKNYKGWQLFDKLPKGWQIDKTCGSPLSGYEFCINGSILNGGKRALVLRDIDTPIQQDNVEKVGVKKTTLTS